jgi:hypothetical protein
LVAQVSRPPIESSIHDDVDARRVLQCAQGMFQKWPEGFAGFAAAITCREGRDRVDGEVRVFTHGRVDLRLEHRRLSAWAQASLREISMARTPRFFKDGDGRFPITFEPQDEHPLGRGVRVHLGGTAWRTYRIDAKGRIRERENAQPTKRVTATYDALGRTCPGRVLPSRIQILDWDVASQSLIERAEIDDAYERRDHVWLPVCRRTTMTHGPDNREVVLELAGHVLL